jgi:arylsulfatase
MDKTGLHARETTIAAMLRPAGYATAMFGKWHLGRPEEFLPVHRGFDEYFGLPYSNDMWPVHPTARKGTYPPLPLIEGTRVVEEMPDQSLLTRRYTERAVNFIERNRDRPFFLYVAHAMPHVPLFASDRFAGHSKAGLYGDVIEEIDWSVGTILSALDRMGLAKNTWVIFTSDNGPWLSYGPHAGSAGHFREGKGTVFEGGIREPCLMRWPGKIPAGRVSDSPMMTIDLLPTIAAMTGSKLPELPIDGLNVWPLIAGEPGAKNPHAAYYFYYNRNELHAVRSGDWKLHLPHASQSVVDPDEARQGRPGRYRRVDIGLELYNLRADPGESVDVARENPTVVARLLGLAEEARIDMGDSLTKRVGKGTRLAGMAR